ncbi:hypothetical protein PPACK8108_LOCUS19603 [Phakopsora pachyrhizi]|uniref:Uncharacterized protein n=1 Tax=Phakopsora pachyrhizi TaxID=170000 RepID=A0AAV0BGE1_PHAPC|nr:hypothetical protein PPACK8108_LOCUS19603 [Phakopsora pachyrhizi]
MSKLDGKPDDVHDEEYHTMIEGMLSNKEFRKTLPAGLVEQYYDLTCGYSRPDQFGPATSSFSESDNLNLFNGNLITILINATKKATNATAAILGNHNKTTNPGTFLSASTVAMAPHPNSSPGLPIDPNRDLVKRRSAPRPSSLQQNGEIVHEEENGGKKDLTSKIVKVLPVHEVMCPFTGLAGDIDSSKILFLSISRGPRGISMEKIKCTPKLKAVVVVYCIRARGLMDKLFMEEMVMERVRAGGCKARLRLHIWTIHCLSEGRGSQVLIDDQLAKQLGVTTGTDDQISRPSVTPIKDSIGHHPPNKQVGNGGKRLTKQWDCPETDYADHHKLDPDPDSLNTPPHNILNFKSTSLDYVQTKPSSS